MAGVDSSFVLLPRFTTLVGAPAGFGPSEFATIPMDVSAYGGVQFQVWRGAFRTKSGAPAPSFKIYLEESLDTETWVLGPSTPTGYDVPSDTPTFFSYSFRLRWFRLRAAIDGDEPIVSCWAEGLLRDGGSGIWPGASPGNAAGNIDIGRDGQFSAGLPRGYTRGWNAPSVWEQQALADVQAGRARRDVYGRFTPLPPSG